MENNRDNGLRDTLLMDIQTDIKSDETLLNNK